MLNRLFEVVLGAFGLDSQDDELESDRSLVDIEEESDRSLVDIEEELDLDR